MTVATPARAGHGDSLYSTAAVVALIVVFAGFARTFFLRQHYGSPALPVLPILHGLIMTCWFTLFLVQARLVGGGRVRLHRTLGGLSLALAVAVVIVGVRMSLWAARLGHTPGPPPLIFLGVPLSEMVVFVVFAGLGFHYRKRPELHKRFMLLANLGILSAAVARIPLDFIHNGGPLVYFGLVDLIVLVFVAWDVLNRRRLHPVFGWSAGLLILFLPVRLMIMGTPAWLTFATWAVR